MTYADAMAPLRLGQARPALRPRARRAAPTTSPTPRSGCSRRRTSARSSCPAAPRSRARTLDAWQEWAKQRGARGLAYVLVGEDGELGGPVAKNLSDAERAGLAAHVGAAAGRLRLLRRRRRATAARRCSARPGSRSAGGCGLIDERAWSFVWVVDAPLFEPAAEAVAAGDVAVGAGAWTAVHHAFTSPKPESLDTFDTDPGSALAYAYDIVCNGNEIGGGSIRIHRRDVQERVFAVMGLDRGARRRRSSASCSTRSPSARPPHGGIAFGWDRICALLAGADSIRDVIAFPKTGGGYDPLTARARADHRRSSARRPE